MEKDIAAFWDQIKKTEKCWEWMGARQGNGYGCLSIDGKSIGAHRASWEIHNGKIPAKLFVCHHCDNRRCVRPDHLFLGTAATNAQDMASKGRGRKPTGPLSRPRAARPPGIRIVKQGGPKKTTSVRLSPNHLAEIRDGAAAAGETVNDTIEFGALSRARANLMRSAKLHET